MYTTIFSSDWWVLGDTGGAYIFIQSFDQSGCSTLDWVLVNQSNFDWVLYTHNWEFQIQKKIIPMLACLFVAGEQGGSFLFRQSFDSGGTIDNADGQLDVNSFTLTAWFKPGNGWGITTSLCVCLCCDHMYQVDYQPNIFAIPWCIFMFVTTHTGNV